MATHKPLLLIYQDGRIKPEWRVLQEGEQYMFEEAELVVRSMIVRTFQFVREVDAYFIYMELRR